MVLSRWELEDGSTTYIKVRYDEEVFLNAFGIRINVGILNECICSYGAW